LTGEDRSHILFVEVRMKYTNEELKEMSATELNKILLRKPVYMVSKFGGALLFGAIEESQICDGWEFYKIDWHNSEEIASETDMPDEWVRCDKVKEFSVKKMSRILRYNYTY
jgi:hypothetical protein